MLRVHSEILQEPGVVQVVGEILWEREIAETGHFLGGVCYQRSVDTDPPGFGSFLCKMENMQPCFQKVTKREEFT